ncbi:MAG: zinc ribbon domain-containing protein [Candidatus Methanomethylicaceae archaeon]
MECPNCKAENRVGARFCNKCGYRFVLCPECGKANRKEAKFCAYCRYDLTTKVQAAPEPSPPPTIPRQPVRSSRLFVALAGLVVLLTSCTCANFVWKRFLAPVRPVLALRGKDVTELYSLDWRTGKASLIATSKGQARPIFHWSLTSYKDYLEVAGNGGYWAGGGAYLLPENNRVVYATQSDNGWEVGLSVPRREVRIALELPPLVDISPGKLHTLVTGGDGQVFVSIAPEANLVAVSTNSIEKPSATVQVFSLKDGRAVSKPVSNVFRAEGMLAPNGKHLLYSVTISGTSTTVRGNITTTTELYTTTLYLANINGTATRVITSFIQPPDLFGSDGTIETRFSFTYDSRSVLYATPTRELHIYNLKDKLDRKLAAFEGARYLDWQISPRQKYAVVAAINDKGEARLYLVALQSGEKVFVGVQGQDEEYFFLSDKQLLYHSNGPAIYNIAERESLLLTTDNAPLVLTGDLSQGVYASSSALYVMDTRQRDSWRVANTKLEDMVLKLTFMYKPISRSFKSAVLEGHYHISPRIFNGDYVVFISDGSLYGKHVLGGRPPIVLDSGQEYPSIRLVQDGHQILYTGYGENTGIYRVDLAGKDKRLLMRDAVLLP